MYQYETIEDILRLTHETSLPFWEVVLKAEAEETEKEEETILTEVRRRLDIFRAAISSGLEDQAETGSGMSGGQAAMLLNGSPRMLGSTAYRAMAYAVAVSEANAKMYRVVACPTAGACGIMPGALIALGEALDAGEELYIQGFLTGAGIGNVITNRACVAGAVGGCQAECGTAAAMTAGALTAMLGGSAEQISNALAIALKNILGLVCDPVAGLVEVPCVKRNGIHAVHAMSAAEMALAGLESRIPADEVILAMLEIGKALPSALRETSEGGLAKTPTGEQIAAKVQNL